MKKLICLFLVAASFTSCNESGVTVEGQIDSLENKLDTLGNKIEQKAEQVWDSTKERAGDMKDKAEQKWDSSKVRDNDTDTIIKQ